MGQPTAFSRKGLTQKARYVARHAYIGYPSALASPRGLFHRAISHTRVPGGYFAPKLIASDVRVVFATNRHRCSAPAPVGGCSWLWHAKIVADAALLGFARLFGP